MVTTAKEQADRIKRDSERELAAATARRDSITAQLSNVRNMLGTLGGASSLGEPFGDQAPAAPAAPVKSAAETTEDDEEPEEVVETTGGKAEAKAGKGR
ncbi:hypothetical protein [Knoellia subterranea]|uniref:Uncharacterized protein n=1 Tax=Knoellia subterranea KCTC 19937 TaxID=1385521 RepID=A0A0A0JQ92_9MICO|nr:hypothetical protein [Knoellia subterranea]KGN38894.1 hypothetical protein N803_09035 [Knoellia subterranea KCTC 19937]